VTEASRSDRPALVNRTPVVRAAGFTVLELLLALGASMAMMIVAVPGTAVALDEARTAMAARYLASRVMDARLHAIKRSTRVALRFEPAGGRGRFAEYVDGNSNGVRAADIASGVDGERAPLVGLAERFSGVALGLLPGTPDVDGDRVDGEADGVRIGASRLLTLGPDGTATPGTLYIRGNRAQYAVRVFGATGRTRVLRFDPGSRQWPSR
jgi:hypothetical protein